MKLKKIFFLFLLFIFQISLSNEKADIIVFSFDRPVQLFSFFESLQKYVKDHDEIWVIYRSSNDRYEKAYEFCFNYFSDLNIKKSKQPNESAGESFKPILMHSLRSSKNKHILFAVDDNIVKDYVNLSECIDYLNKTNAYGFYLRLGKNITECYTEDKNQTPVPNTTEVSKGVYLFDFNDSNGDWGYPCTLDMTLYNKDKILNSISKLNFNCPNRFEGNWHVNEWFFNPNKDKKGLFFENSKIINIPLNVVQTECISRNMGISNLHLLQKYENGLKINIDPLHQIYNKAPHIEFDITLKPIFPFNDMYHALKNQDVDKINNLKSKFNELANLKATNNNIFDLKDENGFTLLMWAANSNCLQAAKFLIENGANVNAEDQNECTALMFACWRGNKEIVDLLIKSNANVDAIDKNGTTALNFADQLESPLKEEIISLLIGQEL